MDSDSPTTPEMQQQDVPKMGVLGSIFEPGVSRNALKFFDYCAWALVITLLLCLIVLGWNIHVFVMLCMSVGLLLSMHHGDWLGPGFVEDSTAGGSDEVSKNSQIIKDVDDSVETTPKKKRNRKKKKKSKNA